MSLSDKNTNELPLLDFFSNLLSWRLFKTSPEDESDPGSEELKGERTKSFNESFTSCFILLAAFQAMKALAAVSFEVANAIVADFFEVVTTLTILFAKIL